MDINHQRRTNRGISFIEIIIAIAILALLAALLLPALAHSKSRALRVGCLSNLKQVGIGFRLWAGDHNDLNPQQIPAANGGAMEAVTRGEVFRAFQCLSNELSLPKTLICPADTRPTAADFLAMKNINTSFFAGLDANDLYPNMFLLGDRNLVINGIPAPSGLVGLKPTDAVSWTSALHNSEGNVGLGDGTVFTFTGAKFQKALQTTGTNLNRLVFP